MSLVDHASTILARVRAARPDEMFPGHILAITRPVAKLASTGHSGPFLYLLRPVADPGVILLNASNLPAENAINAFLFLDEHWNPVAEKVLLAWLHDVDLESAKLVENFSDQDWKQPEKKNQSSLPLLALLDKK